MKHEGKKAKNAGKDINYFYLFKKMSKDEQGKYLHHKTLAQFHLGFLLLIHTHI